MRQGQIFIGPASRLTEDFYRHKEIGSCTRSIHYITLHTHSLFVHNIKRFSQVHLIYPFGILIPKQFLQFQLIL